MLLLLLACSTPDTPPAAVPGPGASTPAAAAGAEAPLPAGASPAAATPSPEADPGLSPTDAAAMARVNGAARDFAGSLRARLQEAVAAGGPPEGIAVCSEAAPAIAAEVGAKYDVKLGRSSLRLRNPADAGPDWVQAWLTVHGERPAEGVVPATIVVDTDAGRVARGLRPIAVEPVCLACHGAPDTLAPAVKDALAARYPDDRATGYAAGDLRGVLWVEAAVKP